MSASGPVPGVSFTPDVPEPAEYLRLFETTGWNAMYRRTADELIAAVRESWAVVSAYQDERLVGVGRALSDGIQYAVIFDLIVDPGRRGRGLGSAILQRLLDRCDAAGIRDVLLFAAEGTRDFYARHGFQVRPANAPGMLRRTVPTN